jgi:hypothetical protein
LAVLILLIADLAASFAGNKEATLGEEVDDAFVASNVSVSVIKNVIAYPHRCSNKCYDEGSSASK